MKFTSNVIGRADMRREEPIVEINKHLPEGNKLITSVKTPKGGVGEYTVYLPGKTDGIYLEIREDGEIDDITIIDGHKWIFKASPSKTFDSYVAKKVAKQLMRNKKARELEQNKSITFNQDKINKLYKEIQDEEDESLINELKELEQLKSDLKKGSGKFIIINPEGLYFGNKGYSKRKIFIKTFSSFDEAKKAKKSNDKVVKI